MSRATWLLSCFSSKPTRSRNNNNNIDPNTCNTITRCTVATCLEMC